ncbi:ACP5 [Symbiodinium natans]|uniref:acid phosphatase n=1 Tax=Symbiodinium natans TaxID=878477 RepID=A0A812MQZ3_9DINO|nr:ACP5 [Symbiodinium natans]
MLMRPTGQQLRGATTVQEAGLHAGDVLVLHRSAAHLGFQFKRWLFNFEASAGFQKQALCSQDAFPQLQALAALFLLLGGLRGLSLAGVSPTRAAPETKPGLPARPPRAAERQAGPSKEKEPLPDPFFPATVLESQKYSPHFLVKQRRWCLAASENADALLQLVARQAPENQRGKPKADAKRREKAPQREPVPFDPVPKEAPPRTAAAEPSQHRRHSDASEATQTSQASQGAPAGGEEAGACNEEPPKDAKEDPKSPEKDGLSSLLESAKRMVTTDEVAPGPPGTGPDAEDDVWEVEGFLGLLFCSSAALNKSSRRGSRAMAMARLRALLPLLPAVWAGPSFLAVGDWGGHSDHHPTTHGQVEAAAGMAKVAKDKGAEMVLLLGDNFYDHGVQSTNSPRFSETFEEVYCKGDLPDLPFWVVAGNHDHRGNVSAQLAYSRDSRQWNFPSLYYNLTYDWKASTGAPRTLELLMLDTILLAGPSDDSCLGCELPGPHSTVHAEAEWQWLAEKLNSSTADFLWVAGHYPIYSAGSDGTTRVLVQKLLPLLRAHGAHYLSGHDHMLEHIVVDGVEMFLSGMGKECCYGTEMIHTVPEGAIRYLLSGDHGRGPGIGPKPQGSVHGGFASLQFGDDDVEVTYHDQNGDKLYGVRVAARSGARAPEEIVV